MKKIDLLMVFFAMVVGFSACKKNDEKPAAQTQETLIVGKWTINTSVTRIYENEVLKSTENEEVESGSFFEFKSDKTYSRMNGDDLAVGTYQISDGKLTLMSDDDVFTTTIDKLDASHLTISEVVSETSNGVTTKYVYTWEASK